MNSSPLVTIGAINYNNVAYLIETLESIKNQVYTNTELIIVDDCSSDNSVEVINYWLQNYNKPFKFIVHDKNQGVVVTCNDVIKNANGKYVSFIATDDVMMPEKISRQIEILEREGEETGVVYSDVYLIDSNGKFYDKTLFEQMGITNRELPAGYIFDQIIQYRNFLPAMGVTVRKTCFKAVGLYDEDLYYEDFDMWLRISKQFKFTPSGYISAKYRKHNTSIMQTLNSKFYESTLKVLESNLHFSQAADPLIKKQIAEHAENLYKAGSTNSAVWLKKKYGIDKKLSSLFLYMLATLKIKYIFFDKLRKAFKK